MQIDVSFDEKRIPKRGMEKNGGWMEEARRNGEKERGGGRGEWNVSVCLSRTTP